MFTALRWSIIILGCLLYAWHAAPHCRRALGSTPAGDVSVLLNAHVDRRYRFHLFLADDSPVGILNQSLGYRDVFFVIASSLRLENPDRIPGLIALRALGLNRTLQADWDLELDDRKRPVGFSAQGELGPLRTSASGRFEDGYIRGRYRIGDQERQDFAISGIDSMGESSMSFALVMPPNLSVGQRFNQPTLSLSPLAPYISHERIDYEVLDQEILDYGFGPLPCLRVSVAQHGRDIMHLWVTNDGVIHRALLLELGLRADLHHIGDEGGDTLWPRTRTRNDHE